jgi:hypothetical protein
MVQLNHMLILNEDDSWSVLRTTIRPGVSDGYNKEVGSFITIVAPHYYVDAYRSEHFKIGMSKEEDYRLNAEAILAWRDRKS